MTAAWRAFALPDVSEQSIRGGLLSNGVDSEEVLHVAATASLASAMRRQDLAAISIKDLIDIVVWSGMPGDQAIPIENYPVPLRASSGELNEFRQKRKIWSAELAGRNLRLGILADLRIRRHLDASSDRNAAGVLRRAVPDLRKSIQSLAASGFRPEHVDASEILTQVAAGAWSEIEGALPELFNLREDLWVEVGPLGAHSSPWALDRWNRIERALKHLGCFGESGLKIVYHGFYFFTPPQWAWFHLLRSTENVDQYFVVHDDGRSRVFETWRRFFVQRWEMPVPEQCEGQTRDSAARLLVDSLEGRAVTFPSALNSPKLVEYRTTTEFVASWRFDHAESTRANSESTRLFAANAQEIERLVRRFGFESETESVDLAELPIGQFLLSLHACIESRPANRYRLTLSEERLIDMASSGLLDSGGWESCPSLHIGALRRAMPFFEGLEAITDWAERARVLDRLVRAEVSAFGERVEGVSDQERIHTAASNPLRLVPWCDLSIIEARVVLQTVLKIAEIVEEVVSSERKDPEKYLGWIRRQLALGMKKLPLEVRSEIEAKLKGVGFAIEGELDVEGVIDVVHMLLGRQADFGLDGESEGDGSAVGDLRNIDEFGFIASNSDVHIANLSDTAFPARVSTINWPFGSHCLDGSSAAPSVSKEILRVRSETASLSDLYLFWLALDGVQPNASLTFSWISEFGSERRNASPLVMLLAKMSAASDVLNNAIGGLSILNGQSLAPLPPIRDALRVRHWNRNDHELELAVSLLPVIAASSVLVCPRRFAIQWALGPSHSFQARHHQIMLFGNLQGALVKNRNWGLSDWQAQRVTKDLWRQFTRGQRMSSFYKRRVVPLTASARWQWIYTLGGGKDKADPLSKAYQATGTSELLSPDWFISGDGLIPDFSHDSHLHKGKICESCPVRPHCAISQVD
jgi:hypothetical protein